MILEIDGKNGNLLGQEMSGNRAYMICQYTADRANWGKLTVLIMLSAHIIHRAGKSIY